MSRKGMTRGPGYSRTTITVPRELKQRMKAVRNYVNWSAVAREAFERKLAEVTHMEEVQDMKQVVERLRRIQAEQGVRHTSYDRGLAAGKKWAMSVAAPDQLARLAQYREGLSHTEWSERFHTEDGWRQLAYQLDPNSNPAHGARPIHAKRVFRTILEGRKVKDLDFFRGFGEGALEIWNAVKDQL